ncbi:MAG: hypothetical protein Q3976_05010 [Corynebacterium sp.]|nr:hypothetical protein [Corynebacterium sp.]
MSEIQFLSDSAHVDAWVTKVANQDHGSLIPGTNPECPFDPESLRAVSEFLHTQTELEQSQRTQFERYIGEALRHHLGGEWVELLDEAETGEFGIYLAEDEILIPVRELVQSTVEDETMFWDELVGA